ncbi:MAG: phosphate ABC transporter ATP-binding protein PstB [Nitrospinota bacterium]
MNVSTMNANSITDVITEKKEEAKNNVVLEIKDLKIAYSGELAVKGVSLSFLKNEITAIIGPSGCGKSTMLRCLNRMNDFILGCTVEGGVLYHGVDLYGQDVDPVEVRRKIGMVFQKPNPFPKSIFDNVAWGPLINGFKGDIHALVEKSLQSAALWNEVKDRLGNSAMALSGGQQQRLCIARTLAMEPEVILMDEPCSALDPVSTAHIEDLMFELKKDYTLVIVTHNMQQASRASRYTAFMESGNLIEFGETKNIFTNPKEKRTEDYVTGRFG